MILCLLSCSSSNHKTLPLSKLVVLQPALYTRRPLFLQPPQICRSQSSNFTITVQKLVDSGAPLTVYTTGPVRYTSSSGVETRNISSGLETNEAYTLTVLFSTVAGDSSSSANFSIHTRKGLFIRHNIIRRA